MFLISCYKFTKYSFDFFCLQSMKLRLSRRVVPSARVNLNLYFGKFEDLAKQNLPLARFEMPSTSDIISTELRQLQMEAVNDNLINELLEYGNK